MGDSTWFVVPVMLVCWAIAAYLIWKWGPGLRKRSVQCPEKKVRAVVMADQREGDFACLRVADVRSCSLLAEKPLSCGKGCLSVL